MYQIYMGEGGYGASIAITGVGSFYLIDGAQGLYVGAVNHSAGAGGSPTVIQFDNIGVNLGDVYQAILAGLAKLPA